MHPNVVGRGTHRGIAIKLKGSSGVLAYVFRGQHLVLMTRFS